MILTLVTAVCLLGRLVLALVPYAAEPVEERVDLVELNHFHDERGRPVFDQVVFYDFDPHESRYEVVAWRLAKGPGQMPQKDWERGGYVTVWQDLCDRKPGVSHLLREIRATAIRETWTQYDPELVEREYLPKDKRRELRKVSP